MKKNKSLKGTALVTGAAKRIGRAICVSLAENGYRVIAHYHKSKDAAQTTAALINKNGGICSLIKADLSKELQCAQLIGKVHKKHPGLNVLINSASIFSQSTLTGPSADNFHANVRIHLVAPYILTKKFSAVCKKGNIINILDARVTKNKTRYFDYLLSKKALGELTAMSAVALAPKIRVNAIAPGLILPPHGKQNSHLQRLAKNIPLKKKGDLANITQSVLYLLENDYMTGQILFNDGGEHLI